ncbi:hypothetical protein HWD35_10500 [Tsukamurella tyrosinosolvens]|uniref:GIY-YIG nuclease family protein n=1 Tax=Tsukamurella tyrosinosolvens TaxID=57704 RepID=UPI001CE1AA33|nr:GIY-YIG nuclease family protein [Tsukamurella tyrosinosolvens]MCA4995142.1 hypothetical protein [Tsukamurella tyrosinosolvens]
MSQVFNLNEVVVGVVLREGDTLTLYDCSGVPMPDSVVSSISKHGITDRDYAQAVEEQREIDRLRYAEMAESSQPSRFVGRGSIYAVVVGDRIKIGRSINLPKRLRDYERTYDNYRLIATFESDDIGSAEKAALAQFGGIAGRNEYLPYSEELESSVREYFAC